MCLKTESYLYQAAIANCYDANNQITGDGIVLSANNTTASNTTIMPERQRGKVHDRYETSSSQRVALITTDRQSGFDRILAQVQGCRSQFDIGLLVSSYYGTHYSQSCHFHSSSLCDCGTQVSSFS